MEAFSALLVICAGYSPVSGEFPTQRPVTRSFDVFFDLRLNKRLSKQSWGWLFETLSCPWWRHCNVPPPPPPPPHHTTPHCHNYSNHDFLFQVDARDWRENSNTISLDDDWVIDVPKQYASTNVYCASLGHKANHSFTPNSKYDT